MSKMADEELKLRVGYVLVNEGDADEQLRKDIIKDRQGSYAIAEEATTGARDSRTTLSKMLQGLNMDTSYLEGQNKKDADLTKFMSEQFNKIADVFSKAATMSFDVIDDIYKEMKKASPLLQTLESLFNLAMQLFFMPLGNKLAEVLLPAVVNLVETAAKMWDELGNGNLSSIISYAVDYGVKALSAFFKDIGSSLKDQGGILSSIGSILEATGNFIEGPMLSVVQFILDSVKFVIEHLKEIISTIVAFKVASLAMSILTTQAIITGEAQAMGTSVGTAAGLALLAGGLSMVGMSAAGFADGGVVRHTPGGQLITVAENEDEYIVPKSKMGATGNVTNNFYGYTSDDIREMIDRSVSEKISLSYIKGGF